MTAESPIVCPDDDVLALFVDGQLDHAGENMVKRHIGLCDACRELVAASSRDLFATTDAYSEHDVLAGKYRLEEELGSGGMGRVYRARHFALERTVAIKLLHPHLLKDAGIVRRFEREARAAASLRSPHAVKVLDIDWLPSGAPFIVMEYLDGCDLAVLVDREGPLSPPLAVRYMLEACEALAEAHRNGIIHRDVKPQNLFLANEGSASVVKVLDFGLAKILKSGSLLGTDSLTRNGHVLGSPYYMSPEQIRSSEIDLRTDVWSVGATLYLLLCGHAPFVGPNLAILRARILGDEPKPMALYRAGVSADLEGIVRRCLRADRDERWPTIDELAAALRETALEGATPIASTTDEVAAPLSSSTVFADTVATPAPRSHVRLVLSLVGAGAGAGLAVAIGAAAWPAHRPSDPNATDVASAGAPASVATSSGAVPSGAAERGPTELDTANLARAVASASEVKSAVGHAGEPRSVAGPRARPNKGFAERPQKSIPMASASAAPIDPFALPRTQ